KFEFTSAERLILTQGRMSANVPRQALGFTVETPSAKVVDLGTRFAVKVEADGTTEAHVFEGKIDVSPDQNIQKSTSPRRVAENSGLRIDPLKKSVAKLKSDPK